MVRARGRSQPGGRMKLRQLTRYLTITLLALLLAVACLSSGCTQPLLTCPRAVKAPVPPPPPPHPATVLFATDRAPMSQPSLGFSSEMNLSGAAMSYGARCEDPTTGGMSNCEKPAWLRTELSHGLGKKELLNEIRAANSDVLLFVHGFNISFDESVKITLCIVERTGIQAIPVACGCLPNPRFPLMASITTGTTGRSNI